MSRNPSRRRLSMDASLSAATLSQFAEQSNETTEQFNDKNEATPNNDIVRVIYP